MCRVHILAPKKLRIGRLAKISDRCLSHVQKDKQATLEFAPHVLGEGKRFWFWFSKRPLYKREPTSKILSIEHLLHLMFDRFGQG